MPQKTKAPHHCEAPGSRKGRHQPTRSIPQTWPGTEFSGLDAHLRRCALTSEERRRLEQTASAIEREDIIERCARYACEWFKSRVERAVDRRISDLLDLEPRELAAMVRNRRWMR
jgi:hypothetical protein